ncbi:heat shock cognate 70 kDa protein 3-like [Uloborus diversus]|nr:heat shock cognate 70 kDa protein 3-like [Uloborus diversus]
MKLHSAAEHYKHVVHSSINERCQAESVYDGIDLNVNISKARFDSLIHSTLLQCLEPIKEALKSASVASSEISKVILVGGSCKIPKLQQMISNMFSSANILYHISPDEVLAVGAAKQAVLVNHNLDDENYYANLLSQDLSIKVSGVSSPGEILLCCRGTLIPTVITQSFTVTEKHSNIKVEVFEGSTSSNEEDHRTLLAALSMSNLPVGVIYFSFQIRSDGSLRVICKDCTSRELGTATVVSPTTQECS